MEMVSIHTDVPVPTVMGSLFSSGGGTIIMSIVPGDCLEHVWDDLDSQSKISICSQVWDLVYKWRCIPKPLELQHLYQCTVDGKAGRTALLSIQTPRHWERDSDILSDEALRQRICDNYYDGFGRKYTKAELFSMLPHSDKPSVFTHGDLAKKNIMVSGTQVTGILDWEDGRSYPEYWEYMCVMSAGYLDRDWQSVMTACAPQTWDLTGINAARRILM